MKNSPSLHKFDKFTDKRSFTYEHFSRTIYLKKLSTLFSQRQYLYLMSQTKIIDRVISHRGFTDFLSYRMHKNFSNRLDSTFRFFSSWWNRFEPIAFCVHIFKSFSLKRKKYTNEIVRSNAIIQIQITKSSRLSFVSIALLTVIPLTAHPRLVFCVHLVFSSLLFSHFDR